MLDQQRLNRILSLALPIIGGMVSQNVLNLVDTAMVSRLDQSSAALAACGYGGFMVFVAQAVVLGLSTGVQATASRRKGEGRLGETAFFLNAALVIVLVTAPVFGIVLYYFVPTLFPIVNDDPEVLALGIPYLQIRAMGIVFVAMNFSFRGYWNAIDMTRLYMLTLISMHVVNIVLNYILIFGNFGAPALGVRGAAIASVASLAFGSLVYFSFGLRYARENGFLHGLPPRDDIWTLLRISIPPGIQQQFFAAGFLATFWIIGQIGTAEVAAANVLINVMLVALLPGMGLGMSAATLVGQALGRGDVEDAAQWAWDVVKVAMIIMGVLGLPMALFPAELISAIYTLEPRTLEVVQWPLRLVGMTMIFEALGMSLQFSLQGAGYSRPVMVVTIVSQWLIYLPLAFIVGPVLGFGLTQIWLLNVTYRALQSFVFVGIWHKRRWAEVRI